MGKIIIPINQFIILIILLSTSSCNIIGKGSVIDDDFFDTIESETPETSEPPTSISYASDGPAVFTWRTTIANETVTLPLVTSFTYNMVVDWGDGSSSTITAFDDPEITHTYIASGDHQMTMTGVATSWRFGNSGDKDKLISVESLGGMGWTSLLNAFQGCTNLISFAGGETSSVTAMTGMFRGAAGLTSVDLSSFDTSSNWITESMFQDASSITSLDLSNFTGNSLIATNSMFEGATNLVSVNFGSFDTASVANMSNMFKGATALTSLNLSSFDTANVTNMASMFEGTTNLTSLNVNNWDINPLPTATTILSGVNGGLVVFCSPGSLGQADFFGEVCN